MSFIPIILIAVGAYIYWANFGWALSFDASLGFYAAAFFVLMGLILMVKRRY